MLLIKLYNIWRTLVIILIGGEKGGTGKTTLVTNLSAKAKLKNLDIVLHSLPYPRCSIQTHSFELHEQPSNT